MRCKLCLSLGSNGPIISLIGSSPKKEDLLQHCKFHAKQISFCQDAEKTDQSKSSQNFDEEIFRACFGEVPMVAHIKKEIVKLEDNREVEMEDVAVKEEPREKVANRNQAKSKGKTSQSKKNPYPIPTFCRKLFAKRPWMPKIVCNICAKSLCFLMGGRTEINNNHIAQHAIAHLGLPMYSCRVCPFTSTRNSVMGVHLVKDHVLSELVANYEDHSGRYTKRICKMIEQCFGQSSKNNEDNNRGDPSIFSDHFQKLHVLVWKRASHVHCHECRRDILVTRTNGILRGTKQIVDHAMMHLRKFLFTCNTCSHRTCTRNQMCRHLYLIHGLGPHVQNYTDSTMKNREDILGMIDTCFGRKDEDSTERSADRRAPISIAESMIKSRAGDNHQLAERLLYSKQLYESCKTKSDSIECLVCQHQVKCSQGGSFHSQKLIWHASTHTNRLLYECKRCSKSIHVMSSVYRHMKKEHAITKGVNKEIIDHSELLHGEIMDALKRSFDHSGR